MQDFDCVVVGSGIAGLTAALSLPESAKVLVVSKGRANEGSTAWAQGGIAAVVSPLDSIEQHIQDTLVAGAGLCRPDRVDILAREGRAAIQWLVDRKTSFRLDAEGDFRLALEGGHSVARILNARDATGREISKSLLLALKSRPNITLRERVDVLDLLIDPKHQSCQGVLLWDRAQKICQRISSSAVFLATGGAGRLFRFSTNPWVSNGDGVALGLRAGAQVEDMEFIQFHPTGFYSQGNRAFLISEAVRGHGAILRNHLGQAFMQSEHLLKDLAPRDIVARGVDRQLKQHKLDHVWLDITHFPASDLKDAFPTIYAHCQSKGIDMARDQIPVVPSAHYQCGGIKVDEFSKTCVPGLYALGEVSCTGVHGANRLASNSLLEGVVFARRAARHWSQSSFQSMGNFEIDFPQLQPNKSKWVAQIQSQLRQLMWTQVGIVRTDKALGEAQDQLQIWQEQLNKRWQNLVSSDLPGLRNMLLTAQTIVKGAQLRRESRGLHYSLDCPHKSPHIAHHSIALIDSQLQEIADSK